MCCIGEVNIGVSLIQKKNVGRTCENVSWIITARQGVPTNMSMCSYKNYHD